MNPIFNELFFRKFNHLFMPIALVWSLFNIGALFLPQQGIADHAETFEPFFEMMRLGDKFLLDQTSNTLKSKTITTTEWVPSPHRVKAIFRSPSASFISINDGKTTQVVALGKKYKKEYTLIGLNDHAAIFKGNGKSYRLRLGYDDPLSFQQSVTRSVEETSANAPHKNQWLTLPRDDVIRQAKDLKDISKKIKLGEVYKENKIDGFRVNAIDTNSIFATLGLLPGDIIVAVNNKKLTSYADAFSVYNKIGRMHSIQITVLRNNLQKEIVYEITR